jgi:hypothetical protein
MEQELMVRHPNAYPVLMPIAVNSLPLERLLIPRKPEMVGRLLLNDANSSEPADTAMASGNSDERSDGWYNNLSHLAQSQIDLLLKVDIKCWTELPIPNDVAIRVIALYLNNDYPVLPVFNADLFLRDLSQNRSYFCSRLLVSALLGWACVSQSSRDWLKANLLYSKLTHPYILKQHRGARFSLSMLKFSGTNWVTTSLSPYQTYLHCSF